jgi:Short C-terminal domain
MFGHGWDAGTATIVAMKETSAATTGEHGTYRALYAYAADVQPDGGGTVFRTEIDEPFEIPGWFTPGVGDVLPVRCDPRRGKAKFDMARLKAARKAQASAAENAQTAGFDAAMGAAPGTSVSATAGDPTMLAIAGLSAQTAASEHSGAGDTLDQLQRLSDLHDRGVLSDAEFAAAKAKILG